MMCSGLSKSFSMQEPVSALPYASIMPSPRIYLNSFLAAGSVISPEAQKNFGCQISL